YIAMDIICGKENIIGPIYKYQMGHFWDILLDIGVNIIEHSNNKYSFKLSEKKIDHLQVSTGIFPELYTDLHPILVFLCKHINIDLELRETIMNDRFKYIDELNKLGYS